MKKFIWLFLFLFSTTLQAQTVSQGPPADATNVDSWPVKIIYGNAQVDPRDVSDRSGRILGQVIFVVPQHVIVDSGTVNAIQSGIWTVTGAGGTFPVTGTFWPTTAGAPSSTRLSDGVSFYDARSIRALTFAGDKVDVSGSTGVGVTGPLTDAQLRITPVPVSGTIAATQSGTWAIGPAVGSASATFTLVNDNLVIDTSNGTSTVGFMLTGASWATTLKFQGSNNGGANWFDLLAVGTNFTPIIAVPSVSSNGQNGPYLVNTAGFSSVRTVATVSMTGSLNISAFYVTHDSSLQYTYTVGGIGSSMTGPSFSAVGDPGNFNVARVLTGDAVSSDRGLIVRNVPGNQLYNVTGTVSTGLGFRAGDEQLFQGIKWWGGWPVLFGPGPSGPGVGRMALSSDSRIASIGAVVCGTGSINLCKAEGQAVDDGDPGVPPLTQRQVPLTIDTPVNGSYQPEKSDDYGRTFVNLGEAPTYNISAQVAAGAAVDYLSVFNATGSGRVVRISSIRLAWAHTAGITPIANFVIASKTSTAGTTCTNLIVNSFDSLNPTVPAQVTGNALCTTDPTVTFNWMYLNHIGEEGSTTNPLTVDTYVFQPSAWNQPFTLRENEGLMLKSVATLVPTGTVGVNIQFSITTK